ncbi:MAG TPA: Uma2 family endonuclease [Acidimicrobiales bacterium]
MSALAYDDTDPGPPRTDLTWDEFLALPFETRNASLIDGEVVVSSPNSRHEWIVANLILLFRLWVREAPGRGTISTQQPVKVTDRRGYLPDFAWHPPERCRMEHGLPAVTGLPGLIVEVLSPSTRTFDLVRKRCDYEQLGVGEVWFLEQDAAALGVVVCQRVDGGGFVDRELRPGDTLTSPLLDGFTVDVAELYRPD